MVTKSKCIERCLYTKFSQRLSNSSDICNLSICLMLYTYHVLEENLHNKTLDVQDVACLFYIIVQNGLILNMTLAMI